MGRMRLELMFALSQRLSPDVTHRLRQKISLGLNPMITRGVTPWVTCPVTFGGAFQGKLIIHNRLPAESGKRLQ